MRRRSSSSSSSTRGALSIAQAARVWGMSEGALRRRVADGSIQAIRGTSRKRRAAWLIEAATIEALLAARWCSRELRRVEGATR
jgi:hypothetical protein